ncbi:glycosyltransferase family 2 protein [Rhodopseudomonas sp.]|uniref:glycosyltransferase family 2 protein n=1 Tax=Rhodopseudomonas sp. TaxID=1078 RepID=UPI003B3A459B
MLSLVIPCFNEARNLPLLLERCSALAAQADVEVIIVDNGSSDGTPAVLEEALSRHPGCRSVRVDINQGYGFGILSGLRAAQGDLLAWTHADLQTDPLDLLSGLRLFAAHGPGIFVKGQRRGRPFKDVVFTVGMSAFETLLLRERLWDINAQPTMFSRAFFETWQNPPHDFSLDLYAYYQARRAGLPVHRFPVVFGERAHGVSHWNVDLRSKWKFIKRTVDFSFELKGRLSQ